MISTIRYLLLSATVIIAYSGVVHSATQDFGWENPLKTNLLNLADSLSNNLKPWVVPNKTFKVEDFGAKSDGNTLNTMAIQKAIDSCSGVGGGVVLFSSGEYVTGTIQIKSGVMIEVSENAKILGSTKLDDYPEKIEEFKSVMSENHKFRQSLIFAEKAQNIGFRGKGEIYFRGEKANFPGKQTTGEIVGRPFGIRMIQCTNVVVQDIHFHNAAAWMQDYLYCNNLIFDGMRVTNHANFNNDGLDLDGCNGAIVRNCTINSEDDAMCLKGCSGKPTQNILIENSTFVTTCNAFKFGTDTQGPFYNIIARNLVLGGIPDSMQTSAGRQASTGVTIATVDGGNIENVYISDITINQSRCPVFIRIGKRSRVMPGLPKPPAGYLKKIVIKNVNGDKNLRQGSFISGISGAKIEDVIISDYAIKMEGGGTTEMARLPVAEGEYGYPDAHQFSVSGLPAHGFYVRHAHAILFRNTDITPASPDARPKFISGGDVTNATANGDTIQAQEIVVVNYTPKYIKNLTIASTAPQFKIDSALIGALPFVDRTFMFTELHEQVKGAEFISWQNGLKSFFAETLVSFTVNTEGKVYIAHDNRLAKPAWLKDGFTATSYRFSVSGASLTLYQKTAVPGDTLKLGANQIQGSETGDCNNYLIFFMPASQNSTTKGKKKSADKSQSFFYNKKTRSVSVNVPFFSTHYASFYDFHGRRVFLQQLKENTKTIDISTFPSGLYTYTLTGISHPEVCGTLLVY